MSEKTTYSRYNVYLGDEYRVALETIKRQVHCVSDCQCEISLAEFSGGLKVCRRAYGIGGHAAIVGAQRS